MELDKAIRMAQSIRFQPGQRTGHYESYFFRANHPSRPRAFWLRYTVFNPIGHPENALGELWAVYFDGERGKHVAVKSEHGIDSCIFKRDRLELSIGKGRLSPGKIDGLIKCPGTTIEWSLSYAGEEKPVFDLPVKYYNRGFPKAKVLVMMPFAAFKGSLRVNESAVRVDNWMGSTNHNWGSKHTDHYAWGQVVGFDNEPDAFLECATARIKIGPLWTPFMTPVVLRYHGREYALNSMGSLFGRARFSYFNWDFHAGSGEITLEGRINADREDFVCLPYYNPPGGSKYCLNTKIASCSLRVRMAGETKYHELHTANRAAFEILTDDDGHGLKPDI